MWEPQIEPPTPPTWMPPRLVEARRFSHFGSLAFLLAAAVHLLWLLAWLLPNLAWFTPAWVLTPGALLNLIAIAGCLVGAGAVKVRVVAGLDSNRFTLARTSALLWAALAVVFVLFGATLALFPAILLAIAWIQLQPKRASGPTDTNAPRTSDRGYPPPDQWQRQSH